MQRRAPHLGALFWGLAGGGGNLGEASLLRDMAHVTQPSLGPRFRATGHIHDAVRPPLAPRPAVFSPLQTEIIAHPLPPGPGKPPSASCLCAVGSSRNRPRGITSICSSTSGSCRSAWCPRVHPCDFVRQDPFLRLSDIPGCAWAPLGFPLLSPCASRRLPPAGCRESGCCGHWGSSTRRPRVQC